MTGYEDCELIDIIKENRLFCNKRLLSSSFKSRIVLPD